MEIVTEDYSIGPVIDLIYFQIDTTPLKTIGCIYLHQNRFWISSFERIYFPSAIRILSPKGRDIIILFAQRNNIKCCIHKDGKLSFKRDACFFL